LQVVTMGIFGLGGPEIAVIAGVAVLIFGEHLGSAKATWFAALRLCWQVTNFVTCRPQQNSRLGKRGWQGSQELSASSQGMCSWHTAKQKNNVCIKLSYAVFSYSLLFLLSFLFVSHEQLPKLTPVSKLGKNKGSSYVDMHWQNMHLDSPLLGLCRNLKMS